MKKWVFFTISLLNLIGSTAFAVDCTIICEGTFNGICDGGGLGWYNGNQDPSCPHAVYVDEYYVTDIDYVMFDAGFTQVTFDDGSMKTYTKDAAPPPTTCTSPRSFPAVNPSVSAGTKILGSHYVNLMSNINYLRADAGLGACGWTQGTAPVGRKIYATDINDLRACLVQVYTTCTGSCGVSGGCSTFNVTATAGVSKVLATDIQRLVTGIDSAP